MGPDGLFWNCQLIHQDILDCIFRVRCTRSSFSWFFILSVCFDGVKDNELLIDIESQGVKSGIESKASVDTRITAAQRTPT